MINADQYDSAPASISTTVSGGAIGGIVCGALNFAWPANGEITALRNTAHRLAIIDALT